VQTGQALFFVGDLGWAVHIGFLEGTGHCNGSAMP
jgi:hypothetical protein